MSRRVRIPVRTVPSPRSPRAGSGGTSEKGILDLDPARPPVSETVPPVVDRSPAAAEERFSRPAEHGPQPVGRAGGSGERVEEKVRAEEDLEAWRDRALRLQAEMDNFRKRQQRLAEDRVTAERERLLRGFLDVADNLERALNAGEADGDGVGAGNLRQGVALTHQALQRLLEREGVEPIEAQGAPFDPTWHEAIGAVSHQQVDGDPDTVVEVAATGYRLGDRLLRPARVVVAN